MKVNISVKGVSNKVRKIKHLIYEYEDASMTLKQFLEETVAITLSEYNEQKQDSEMLRILSDRQMEDQAEEGKIDFGVHYNDKKADLDKAVENVLQCFEDGLIAVFIDGEQYKDIEQIVPVKEGSEVTFVRLAFLVGRMW